MRPIDADALIETMRENAEGNEGWYGDTWAFMRDVENAPTISAEPHWIPCEERLPDIAATYIVSGKMKYSFEAEYEFFTDAADYVPYDEPHNYKLGDKFYNYRFHTWNDWYEGQDEYEILAWMPMPEPYVGEREDDE